MNKAQLDLFVPTFRVEDVKRVYSGKPGCGCGCLGKYYEDAKNIARVSKLILEALANPPADARVGVQDGTGFFESKTRYYWAYTTE